MSDDMSYDLIIAIEKVLLLTNYVLKALEPLTPDRNGSDPRIPTPAQIADLIRDDIESGRADEAWREALPDYDGLLDAEAIEGKAIGVWVYDPKSRRYREKNGRFVGQAKMKELRNDFIDAQRLRARDLTEQMADRKITWNQWQREMQSLIRVTHVDLLALGSGGRRQVSQKAWDDLAFKTLPVQYGYLKDFAQNILDGKVSRAQALVYAEHYIGTAVQTYTSGQRDQALSNDLTQEKNVLGGSQHTCEDCKAESRRGWVKIGTLSLPGTRECRGNCRCHIEMR